eukprot:TRINITY_DN1408_c0_g1_i4.p3 TRINITY_DN1408_c0_g1~~TRINITY_DN1408_c0_g1_i4.p3  ORF type:complete len:106 (+),score=3.65 TRINITY_DN1408_c0_g1_i4:368-685(+)
MKIKKLVSTKMRVKNPKVMELRKMREKTTVQPVKKIAISTKRIRHDDTPQQASTHRAQLLVDQGAKMMKKHNGYQMNGMISTILLIGYKDLTAQSVDFLEFDVKR